MKIDGSIILDTQCIFEKDLPKVIVGNTWYITIQNKGDKVGKLWVPDINGNPVCIGSQDITSLETRIQNAENQINVLIDNFKYYDKCYESLSALGLKDEDFAGLTYQESFDLLLSKIEITSSTHCKIKIRLTMALTNFRVAIAGQDIISSIEIDVLSHGRYIATWFSEDAIPTLIKFCTGYSGFNSGWVKVLSESEITTINNRLTDIETQIINLQNA